MLQFTSLDGREDIVTDRLTKLTRLTHNTASARASVPLVLVAHIPHPQLSQEWLWLL